MKNTLGSIALSAMVLVSAAGCGSDEPISVSAPIGINLKVEGGDVKGSNAVSVDKSITTESGNPWGAFISDVEAQLGGPPADIELTKLELSLAASSTNVTELNEVFDGIVDIQFEMNDTNNFFNVASGTVNDELAGRTVELASSFDFDAYQATDLDKLLGGSFKVVLAGTADANLVSVDGKADLQLTFYFAAFE